MTMIILRRLEIISSYKFVTEISQTLGLGFGFDIKGPVSIGLGLENVHILISVSVLTIRSFLVLVSKLRLTSKSLGLETWDRISKVSVSRTETLI